MSIERKCCGMALCKKIRPILKAHLLNSALQTAIFEYQNIAGRSSVLKQKILSSIVRINSVPFTVESN